MSSTRFAVLLGLAAVVVAAAAFLLGLRVLDDGGPDQPPSGASPDLGVAAGEDAAGEGTGDPPSSTAEAAATDGELPSPSWVLVISSQTDGERARAVAEEVAAAGYPSGLLRSDDHPSLNPGFWVAYAGPYPGAAAAAEAEPAVEADGWTGAYVRCVGTTEDCGQPGQGGRGDG